MKKKVSAMTMGAMIARLLLDYEVAPECTLADRSGEEVYKLTVEKFGVVAGERKFRRTPGEFLGVAFKFWEEVP